VFLIGVIVYFLLACLLSWVVLFPAGRAFVLHCFGQLARGWQRQVGTLGRLQGNAVLHARNTGGGAWHAIQVGLRRYRWLVLAGTLLISLPPLLAWWSGGTTLEGFDAPSRDVNMQVAQLLEGEQLVPPAALPPLVFTTAEVEQERPMTASASRDWGLMNPQYMQRLLMAFKIMKEQHGYDMAILEGYRSPERQNLLAKMGSSVTNAAAFQSWHQYGLAADCAFLRNGKIVVTEKDPWAMRGYQLYGEVAESLGLTWGGRWKMMDFGHTELRLPGVMRRPPAEK
jgi:peptidoglycan L-alanyl-D-glutamate endopeptidase CwlK